MRETNGLCNYSKLTERHSLMRKKFKQIYTLGKLSQQIINMCVHLRIGLEKYTE